MALINKTGITNGGTIQAEHVTRAIDALSGGSSDTVSITGSLMGSSSYAVTASYALNGGGGSSATASYALTASYARSASIKDLQYDPSSGTYYPVFVSTASGAENSRLLHIDTSLYSYNTNMNLLTVTASNAISSSTAHSASNAIVSNTTRGIALASSPPINPPNGTFYIEAGGADAVLFVYMENTWFHFSGSTGIMPS